MDRNSLGRTGGHTPNTTKKQQRARRIHSGPAIYCAFIAIMGRGFLPGGLKGPEAGRQPAQWEVCECGGGDRQACGEPSSRVGPRPTLFPRSSAGKPEVRPSSKWKLRPSPAWRGEAPAAGGNQDKPGRTELSCTCYPGCRPKASLRGPGKTLLPPVATCKCSSEGPWLAQGPAEPATSLLRLYWLKVGPAYFPSNQKGVGGEGH